MTKLDGFETYTLYLSLKSHFTQKNYDYFKYHGKVRASRDSFTKRRDRYQFERLAKQYDASEMKDFLLSNFLDGKKWVGDFLDDTAATTYDLFCKRREAFTYYFTNEITAARSSVETPRDLFRVSDGQYPPIITLYLSKIVSIETLAVLDVFVKFTDQFDKKISPGDPIWDNLSLLIRKTQPFVSFDRNRIRRSLQINLNNATSREIDS